MVEDQPTPLQKVYRIRAHRLSRTTRSMLPDAGAFSAAPSRSSTSTVSRRPPCRREAPASDHRSTRTPR